MKKLVVLFIVIFVFTSCKDAKKETVKTPEVKVEYASFGDKITPENVIDKEAMYKTFKSLKKGDTVAVKFSSKINNVCKKKGCWMRLDLGKGEEALVRFVDYGFFMPLNSENREVIVEGKAYLDVVTVAELRHYAKDENATKEEIEKITEDEITFAIESNGVLMVK